MKTEPQMSDLPAEKQASKAIAHTLLRIAEQTTVAYHCGYGTQTYALLTEAQATLTGKTIEEIQDRFPPAQPKELPAGSKRDCPFCGGSYLEVKDVVCGHAVHCGDCDLTGPESYESEADAIEKWNVRSIQRL